MTTQELRESTASNNVIFFDGKELDTKKSGGMNSAGGLVLSAYLPEFGRTIQHRSNDNYGRKGFTFQDASDKFLSTEIRNRLEYKY